MMRVDTRQLFYKFQWELRLSTSYTVFQVCNFTYKVCTMRDMSNSEAEDPDKGRDYIVTAYIAEGTYYYQCCKFERDGVICCHILRVMDMNGVKQVPPKYVLECWSWNTDEALCPHGSQQVLTEHEDGPNTTMETVRRVVMTRRFTNIANDACKNDVMSRAVERHTNMLERELDSIKKRMEEEALHRFPKKNKTAPTTSTGPSTENSEVGSGASNTHTHMGNPPRKVTKGRPKQIIYKSTLEIQAKHKKPTKKTTAEAWAT